MTATITPTAHQTDATQTVQQLVQELPDACERLAYVRRMTEQAANKVLNLVESAQDDAEQVRRQGADLSDTLCRLAVAPDLSLERARSLMKLCAAYAATAAAFAGREKSLHSEIMMAQDFQDLSGQVINKVMRMLERSEQPLVHLLGSEPAAAPLAMPEPAMLEGVQTPDKALKQDDVDDLLASLGF
jgi:chemotaxis protein CheZ